MHHFAPTHTHIHSATEMQMYIATLLCKKETKIEVEEKTEIIFVNWGIRIIYYYFF